MPLSLERPRSSATWVAARWGSGTIRSTRPSGSSTRSLPCPVLACGSGRAASAYCLIRNPLRTSSSKVRGEFVLSRARLVVLAILIVTVAVLAVRYVHDTPGAGGGEEGPATTRFTAPRFVGYHQGVRQWELEADEIEERQDEKGGRLVDLTRVRHGILYRDGEESMRFEADRGVWHEESSDLTLEADVVFASQAGMRFPPLAVYWSADPEARRPPPPGRGTSTGEEFVADQLHGDVKARGCRLIGSVRWTNEAGALVRAHLA